MIYRRTLRALLFALVSIVTACLAPLSTANAAQQPSPEIVVAPDGAPKKILSATASDAAGNFVVVWTSRGGTNGRGDSIFGQRYDAGGAPRGGVFQVTPDTTVNSASVAMDAGGRFFVVWAEVGSGPLGLNLSIHGRRFDSAGAPEGAAFQIASSAQSNGGQGATVAMNSLGEAVVAWNERSDLALPPFGTGYIIRTALKMQRFNARGQRKGLVQTVASGTSYSFSLPSTSEMGVNVAINNSGLVVVTWTHENPTGDWVVYARRYGPQGVAQGPEFQASSDGRVITGTDPSGNPIYSIGYSKLGSDVAVDDAGIFTLSWLGRNLVTANQYISGVYKRRYSADGLPLENETLVAEVPDIDSSSARIVLDGTGNPVVAWTTFRSDIDNNPVEGTINAQRFDVNGTAAGAPIRLNTQSERVIGSPSLAAQPGSGFIAGWIAGRPPYVAQFSRAAIGDAEVVRCCTP